MKKTETVYKNPAYGRHQLSRPMRIEGPIQIRRGCMIYAKPLQDLEWDQAVITRTRFRMGSGGYNPEKI